MPDIYSVADRFRRELTARQSRSVGELTRAYGLAWQRIQESLSTISRTIEIARANGLKISPAWLVQFDRLESLKRQVESEINKFADFADLTIRADQFDAIQAARANADVLLRASTGLADDQLAGVGLSFSRLPVGAIEAQVGLLANGSPLRTLLGELGKEAAGKVADVLTTAVALGYGPRRTAAMVRESLGGNAARALTIARTETMRAYREAASRTYEANADVLDGWIWTASLSGRTCAMCIAMHGTVHPLTERLDSHPNCRCVAAPRTKPFEELGLHGVPDTRPDLPESGMDWFARQPEAVQLGILGPEKFSAYRAGDITLKDLVGMSRSKEWGVTRSEKSLKAIRSAKSSRPRRTYADEDVAILKKLFSFGTTWDELVDDAIALNPKDRVLDKNEKAAILGYTRSFYLELNRQLRRPNPEPLYRSFASVLQSGLRKLPDFSGIVRRGVERDSYKFSEMRATYHVGAIITEPQFTSATYGRPFPGSVQMRIFSRTGKNIELYSHHGIHEGDRRNEKEVLFRTRTRFKVLLSEVKDDTLHLILEEL